MTCPPAQEVPLRFRGVQMSPWSCSAFLLLDLSRDRTGKCFRKSSLEERLVVTALTRWHQSRFSHEHFRRFRWACPSDKTKPITRAFLVCHQQFSMGRQQDVVLSVIRSELFFWLFSLIFTFWKGNLQSQPFSKSWHCLKLITTQLNICYARSRGHSWPDWFYSLARRV